MNENAPGSEKSGLGIRDRMVGTSEAINSIRTLTRKVAATKISVLIQGESGTGKDVVARLIHDLSPRRDGPFVPVNCAAIPEGLFESEMFGHERGSFTGAEKLRRGYFEQASGGTLFLDEVGDMPLAMQVKVLRALESGEYYRVGGTKSLQADVRIIAASNRDLRQAVSNGRFREDLYFRLRAIEIDIPPLRDRREDIPALADRFVDDFARENKIARPRIMESGYDAISRAEWPGNVRELKHFIGTILTLERDEPIDSSSVYKHLPGQMTNTNLPILAPVQRQNIDSDLLLQLILDMRREIAEIKEMISGALVMGTMPNQLPERLAYTETENHLEHPTLQDIERQQIRQVLSDTNGNRRRASEILGIGERTLYRKIKEFGL